ncbi:MAG: hypothetical protein HQK54_07175 [Oligoflexales bacterium]|nr:hypothetical protein [Oligoflexales bacterium]
MIPDRILLKALLLFLMVGSCGFAYGLSELSQNNLRSSIVVAADFILENYDVSYVYGGSRLAGQDDCDKCVSCASSAKGDFKKSLGNCQACRRCSLDCSHFINLVYKVAGLEYPYIPTGAMINLSRMELRKKYHFIEIGDNPFDARPGDLLVYHGHVVLLEKLHKDGFGDIIHATSGLNGQLRGPGLGVQRARRVNIGEFRGRLVKILRHEDVAGIDLSRGDKTIKTEARLRPVKRSSVE